MSSFEVRESKDLGSTAVSGLTPKGVITLKVKAATCVSCCPTVRTVANCAGEPALKTSPEGAKVYLSAGMAWASAMKLFSIRVTVIRTGLAASDAAGAAAGADWAEQKPQASSAVDSVNRQQRVD